MGAIEEAVSKFISVAGKLLGNIPKWDRERRQKERLKKMLLDSRFEQGFRTIGKLMAAIAADRATTERLLFDIGARPSEKDKDKWTLKPPPPSRKT